MFISQLGIFLFDLHETEQTQLPTIDIKAHLNNYIHIVQKKSIDINHLSHQIEEANQIIKLFQPLALCHHDLSPQNIFYSKTLSVVDWEYACVSDPFFDIAGLCVNFDLNAKQERKLLNTYFKLAALSYSSEKLVAMKKLYKLLNELWYL
jgi:thiamine kinase-like enzyme